MNGSKKTIIIVEDEVINRLYIASALKRRGFRCLEAGDGDKAVSLFKEFSADLILMDINMPGMDGIEATRRIRAVSKVPIFGLTAYSSSDTRAACEGAGMDGMLIKPYTERQIIEILESCLEVS